MTSDYVPIDCDQHSVLELLALRRTAVTLRALEDDGTALILEGVISDVFTRGGAEFLELRDPAGQSWPIRLDRLRGLYDAAGAAIWRQKNTAG